MPSNRSFRVLNIIDDYNKEAIGQETSLSMPSKRVTRILEKVIWIYGKPQNIRVDNGTEFTSKDFRKWCEGNGKRYCILNPGNLRKIVILSGLMVLIGGQCLTHII